MAKMIDPGFQAAPYLGDSSHDPIEYIRRRNIAKAQMFKERKKEQEEATMEGLQKLMVEVKGWADQKGFEEIISDRQKVIDTFLHFSRRGMNVMAPKTPEEQTLYKGLSEKLEKVKYKAQVYAENKDIFDFVQKELLNPKNDELIDKPATRERLKQALQTGDVLNMREIMGDVIVKKPQLEDVYKYIRENERVVTKLPRIGSTYIDESGQERTVTTETWTPQLRKQVTNDLKKLYNSAKPEIKETLKYLLKADETAPKGWSAEDYFIYIGFPAYKEQFIDKPTSAGGGLQLNFMGSQMRITPGRLRTEPLRFGDKEFANVYEFGVNKNVTFPVMAQNTSRYSYGTWKLFDKGGTLTGQLLYYDPNTDSFLFKLSESSNAPLAENNDNVLVPRSVLGESADDLPIQTPEGRKTLKEAFPDLIERPKKRLPLWNIVVEEKSKVPEFIKKRGK